MAKNKNKWLVFALSGPILAAVVVVATLVWTAPHTSTQGQSALRLLLVDGQAIHVSIADTEALRELGLGGRAGLAPDEGMLFIFPKEGRYAFWMKDMKFSIDMLWLANDGTIIYIQPNVSPQTFPKSFQPTSGLARYVLELPANYSTDHNIKAGDKAQI